MRTHETAEQRLVRDLRFRFLADRTEVYARCELRQPWAVRGQHTVWGEERVEWRTTIVGPSVSVVEFLRSPHFARLQDWALVDGPPA